MGRQLKNAHLQRCAYHSSLRGTELYASVLMTSRVLHVDIFELPVKKAVSTGWADPGAG
jgi:hypothetical protein